MSWFSDISRSAVGKKAVMAVSGIILFGFVFVHMVGNLKMYEGPQYMNEYGVFLRQAGAPAIPPNGLLWFVRHRRCSPRWRSTSGSAWKLAQMARAARPQRYQTRKPVTHDLRLADHALGRRDHPAVHHLPPARTSRPAPSHPDFIEGEPYHNVVAGFRNLLVSLFYIVAQVALGFHLYHGVWSLFQSLGWNHPRFNHWRSWLAQPSPGSSPSATSRSRWPC